MASQTGKKELTPRRTTRALHAHDLNNQRPGTSGEKVEMFGCSTNSKTTSDHPIDAAPFGQNTRKRALNKQNGTTTNNNNQNNKENNYRKKMNTGKGHNEQEEADEREYVLPQVSRSGLKDLVHRNKVDIDDVPLELATDMIEYMIHMDKSKRVPCLADYLSKTDDKSKATAWHRTILVDWMIEVHTTRFVHSDVMCPATLYQAIHILDSFLHACAGARTSELQCIGLAALFISAKYNETYLPMASELCELTDGAVSRQQLLSMEREILRVLNCDLKRPTPVDFVDVVLGALECTQPALKWMTHAICESSMLRDFYSSTSGMDLVVAAAVLATRISGHSSTRRSVRQCVNVIYRRADFRALDRLAAQLADSVISGVNHQRLKALGIKYTKPRYGAVCKSTDFEVLRPVAEGLAGSMFL